MTRLSDNTRYNKDEKQWVEWQHNTVVTKDIPSNVTAFGNPCKVHKINEENIGKK